MPAVRRHHLCGGRQVGPQADHRIAVRVHRAAELRAVVLRQQQHQLFLHDGSLPRTLGQRDRRGRDRAADGAAVLGGDAAERAGRHGSHSQGHRRQAPPSLLEHGGSDAGVPAGPVLHQRYLHRLCVHRDLHHRLLRAAVGPGQWPLPHRVGPVHGVRVGGLRIVPDRRDLHLLHHRSSAVPPAPRDHRRAVG